LITTIAGAGLLFMHPLASVAARKKRMRFRADLYQIPFTLLSPSKNTILSWSLHRSVVSSQPVIQINPSTSGMSLEIGV
jgi:hypothetical protein